MSRLVNSVFRESEESTVSYTTESSQKCDNFQALSIYVGQCFETHFHFAHVRKAATHLT